MEDSIQKLSDHYDFVVIGGGIAGVSCVENLSILDNQSKVLLITGSEIIKAASSAIQFTQTLVELVVEDLPTSFITDKYSNVDILNDFAIKLNYADHTVETLNNVKVSFKKLCICTGGKPNLIDDSNPLIIGIRDTESVLEFQNKIKSARRIMIVGNGGIASEIIHEVRNVDKIWVVKDTHITKTFIDAGASEFFQESLGKKVSIPDTIIKRVAYSAVKMAPHASLFEKQNPALGPDWHTQFDLCGSVENSKITIEYSTEIKTINQGDENWPLYVELTNGRKHQVDFIVSATGVIPNSEIFSKGNKKLELGDDGGILVNLQMETSLPDVFAAGDVCTAGWETAPHWFQMRLWTQARQMGAYSAKCMMASLKNETIMQDFCFEIFTHVTKLYGFKVILLGLFNGQKLGDDFEMLLRVTKGKEYVKLILKNGKLQGALLIGETDLEEMCENLILNQLDLTPYGEDLLNPDIDIEDYFD